MNGMSTLVMGQQSFNKVVDSPDWPYSLPVIVLSRSPDAINVLREFGGSILPAVRSCLTAGLVQRMIMILILLGGSRPLWGHDAGGCRVGVLRPSAA